VFPEKNQPSCSRKKFCDGIISAWLTQYSGLFIHGPSRKGREK
jgi:hypothetical protein